MQVDEKILQRYENILNLEIETDNDGEREAARQAREKLEKKYPEITTYFVEEEDESSEEDDPKGWHRFADFFSQVRHYTEFAFGLSVAREVAQRVNFRARNNTSGSLSITARIEPQDRRMVRNMTQEQRAAFFQSVMEDFIDEVAGSL